MNRYYLTDEQWAGCHAFLSAHPRVYVGDPERCRLFLNGVLWILRSGSQWRSLPTTYGHWNSVFKRYDRWVAANIWDDLFSAVSLEADLQEGAIDSTVVRAHAYACCRGKKSDLLSEALGRSKGGFSCKIHALTDALGYPLRFILTAGQAADIGQAEALVDNIPLKKLLADKGYDSQAFVDHLAQQGIEAIIPSRSNAREPRQCDWVAYKERHLIECYFGKMKHDRRVFSRFEKKAVNFLGFLKITAILIWTR